MDVFTTTPSQRQLGYGLLVLRLALGLVFIMHGGQKLFVAGFGRTTNMLMQMNIPAAGLLGPLLAVVEPLAGAALVLGLGAAIVSTDLQAAPSHVAAESNPWNSVQDDSNPWNGAPADSNPWNGVPADSNPWN